MRVKPFRGSHRSDHRVFGLFEVLIVFGLAVPPFRDSHEPRRDHLALHWEDLEPVGIYCFSRR
jgi:hypothetical protein